MEELWRTPSLLTRVNGLDPGRTKTHSLVARASIPWIPHNGCVSSSHLSKEVGLTSEKLTLLRTLILWTLSSSDAVKSLINQSYKQNRHEDDLNQPRSVQPWGTDGDKRRYFLIEGQDDTAFRVYRESNPAGTQRTWWSVAGSIEELKALAEKLETKDGGPKAKKFATKILMALPRFEAGEEVCRYLQVAAG
jgi:hypothetical protein